jgi:hypothetical protein
MGVPSVYAIAFARFDLNISLYSRFDKAQYFIKGGNLLRLGPAARKVCGSIERAQIGEIKIKDVPLAVCSFLNSIVVEDDGMAITTHMYIKLYCINRQCESIAKGCQSVFRGEMGSPAMSDTLKMSGHKVSKPPKYANSHGRFAT